MAADKVSRKIYFYRVEAGEDPSHRLDNFDVSPILSHIDSLPLGSEQRPLSRSEDDLLHCWVDRLDPHQRVRMAVIRKADYPYLWQSGGTLSTLGIGEDSGIAETGHAIFFDNNIVGADFNYRGPRISAYSKYFSKLAPDICPKYLNMASLLNPEAASQIEDLVELRVLDLKIRPADAEVLSQASGGLQNTFNAARELGDTGQIGLLLKPEPNVQRGIGRDALRMVKQLVRDHVFRSRVQDNGGKMVVKGTDIQGDVREIDLLGDKLVLAKKMLRQDDQSRTVDPGSAYNAIEEAYEELEDLIVQAASIS